MAERTPIRGLIVPEDLDDMGNVDALNTNWEMLDREEKIVFPEEGTEVYPLNDGRPRLHITRETIYDRTYGGDFGAGLLGIVSKDGDIRTLNRESRIPLSYYPFPLARGIAVETNFPFNDAAVRTGEVILPVDVFDGQPHVEMSARVHTASPSGSGAISGAFQFLRIGIELTDTSFRYRLAWDIRGNYGTTANFSKIELLWTAIQRKGT